MQINQAQAPADGRVFGYMNFQEPRAGHVLEGESLRPLLIGSASFGLPSDLEIALEIEPTVEGQREIGVEHAANLARELMAGGAPGIHLYAFNQSGPVLDVLRRLEA